MWRFFVFSLGLSFVTVSCRDADEAAMNELQGSGYGFSVSDFHRAAEAGDLDALRRYLKAGMAVDVVDEDQNTAFLKAAAANQYEALRVLMEAGAEPDQRLHEGRTVLMEVASRTGDDLSMLEFLLEHHADPRAVDARGLTSLMIASLSGNVDAVRRLAMRDLRSLDKSLMLAAAEGHTHCLEALVERGAYVNCRSRDTQTPLMFAAGNGHLEATQLLLRHHANRFALDEEGRSAADRAEAGGYPALAAILNDTSSLLPPIVPENNEFLPSLNGQRLALLQEPVAVPDDMFLDPIEPDRPMVDFGNDLSKEVLDERDVSSGGAAAPSGTTPVRTEASRASTTSASVSRPETIRLDEEIRLGRFEERFEPVLVTSVDGTQAKVRLLTRPAESATVTVMVGETIPGTDYQVTRVNKKVRPSKGGGTVDVSEVFTRDRHDDSEQRFVRGSLPRDEATHLVVETKRSQQRYAARLGDRFTVAETNEPYMVTEIRPHQLVVRNEATMAILTISRY